MKTSRLFASALGTLMLGSSAGCFIIVEPPVETGDIQFEYVILENDGAGGVIATPDCGAVDAVRFMVGFDNNVDGILDDNEIFEEATAGCNQFDANGDGFIDGDDQGLFNGLDFTSDIYDLFAVEFLDFGGDAIPWQPFDSNINATRFSFGGGLDVTANVTNVIIFAGAGQNENELQAFFGF